MKQRKPKWGRCKKKTVASAQQRATIGNMASQNPLKQISLFIRAKRRETGKPLREAASQAKISAATLSRLERGLSATLPDAATLNKLAVWLGVSMSELLQEGQSRSKAILPT